MLEKGLFPFYLATVVRIPGLSQVITAWDSFLFCACLLLIFNHHSVVSVTSVYKAVDITYALIVGLYLILLEKYQKKAILMTEKHVRLKRVRNMVYNYFNIIQQMLLGTDPILSIVPNFGQAEMDSVVIFIEICLTHSRIHPLAFLSLFPNNVLIPCSVFGSIT